MTVFQSILLYLVVFTISTMLIYLGQKKKIRLLTLSGLVIPILLSGLRYMVGTDYAQYLGVYSEAMSGWVNYVEPTFSVFANISKMLVGGPTILFCLYAAITVAFFYLGIKKYIREPTQIALAFFLFLCVIFPQSFNAMRQMTAVAIMFFGISYAIEGRLLRYAAIALLATTFHQSALLLVALYPAIRYVKKHNEISATSLVALFAVMVSFMIVLIALPVIMEVLIPFENYSTRLQNVGFDGLGRGAIPQLVLVASLLLFYKRLAGKDDSARAYYILLLTGATFVIGGVVSDSIGRMSAYLLYPFANLLILKVPTTAGKYLPIAYSLAFFMVVYILLGSSDIVPYQIAAGVSL